MSSAFTIRPYQPGEDRCQLQVQQLPAKYIRQYTNSPPFHMALRLLGICTNYLYVMTPNGEKTIVGTILLRKRLQGFPIRHIWKIHALGVAPELRGRGLGAQLLEYAFERLRERRVEAVSLKVDQGNAPAIRLYHRLGFRERARTKDQILFVRQLTVKP
jgi:ribosomal protein S18 acetylase RimI-like enzyme